MFIARSRDDVIRCLVNRLQWCAQLTEKLASITAKSAEPL